MKKDCPPSKVKAYKGLKRPTCECAACWAKYALANKSEDWDEAVEAARNFFYCRFSQLVYETLDLVGKGEQDDLLMQLGDMTSVYGIADRIKK